MINAQLSEPLQSLKSYIRNNPSKALIDSLSSNSLLNNRGFQYLLPFYQAWHQEKKQTREDSAMQNVMLSEAASFLLDQKSMLLFESAAYDPLTDSAKIEIDQLTQSVKAISYIDAKTYILQLARKNRVVMINIAQNKPQTTVFTVSLLESLYQQGYHFLAMEMLDNSSARPVLKLNATTGYYCNEPTAGELIRKALEIGFTLLPYEDYIKAHNANQREYAQAQNIYDFLVKKDSTEKILVVASYNHIEEGARQGERIPMAAYFKIITGIDPLTIDQTEMIEGSTNSYQALFYTSWLKKKPTASPVIPLLGEKAYDPFDLHLYDVHIIHPITRFVNERPVWLSMDGLRKEIPVSPAYQSLFLVQAYYLKEYSDVNANLSVPADQTYQYAANGLYYLYLQKGKYRLVFKDKKNELLGTKDIEVN
jgi:hypothetical protein